MLYRLQRFFEWGLFFFALSLLLGTDTALGSDQTERARAFTRPIEFDYARWTAEAVWGKLEQGAAGLPHTLDREARKQIVMEYLHVTEQTIQVEYQLNLIYADPSIADKETASAEMRARLAELQRRQSQLALLAEAILQEQVSEVLAELGLTSGGQPVPPVLYRSSAVPMGLVVSPRDRIEQQANISVLPDLSVDQQIALEEQVDRTLNVSSLVVPIGGVGVYPTMIMRTTDLPWLLNTIAHEWTHNYLSLRPLGFLYYETPELRTMNETAASIAGNEIGRTTLERFYPELAFSAPCAATFDALPPIQTVNLPFDVPDPADIPRPVFDFRKEMHETRLNVDRMLAEGRIEEAEAYMEARRLLFWENGYPIRKLNQAYFAFYGAYADVPGGAAGEDPVGPAVRALRAQSGSLAEFLNRIAWMTSFEELRTALTEP